MDRCALSRAVRRLGEAFSFEDIEWQSVKIDGLDVAVATPRMLYQMKRDTMRSQDRADVDRLRQQFDVGEA